MPVQAYKVLILISILIFVLLACNSPDEPVNKSGNKNIEESLVEANKQFVKSEDRQIEDFIARYAWTMTKTGTGLRYMIYQKGSGKPVETGNKVTIKYTVGLLNGEPCYSSAETGNKEFVAGQGGVEAGLEEGILFLKKGDRAKFILPSHLGFGLVGDGNKIPAKATLVYDIEIIDLK